jgi:hypothetical protein
MTMFNKAKNLSLLVLLGAWGCTTNQYVSQSGGYDDLYGNNTGPGVVIGDRGADQDISRSDNPDYAYTGNAGEGTSDYYDESYLSSRSVNRALSPDPGYNAGFADGYNRGALNSPYGFGNLGSYWPGSMMNVGFNLGYGRIRPYVGFGFGSMIGMGSMMGYSPWGFNSMYGYGYDPFGYNGFGYSPWGYNSMYGYGYDPYYSGFGGYGYGYNPWAYSRPVVVVNNYESRGLVRTAGPRVVAGTSSRNNSRYNSANVSSPRTASGDRSGRRASSGSTISANDTYSSPRSSRSYNRSGVADAGGRSAAAGSYSRSASEGNNVYYSRPRSTNSYSSDGATSGNYTTPRSSRGSGSSSYSVPSRSQSDYTAPSRGNYQTPSRSESFSAPARTYSQPSYSAPSSRSYSAPSGGGGGGGGATRSSSRGPR